MLHAVWLSVAIILLAVFIFPRRSRHIARLRVMCASRHWAIKKTTHEVKFFNKLRIVTPNIRGLPKSYIDYLARLHINPKYYPENPDAYERLYYATACTNLFNQKKQYQLLKNLMKIFVVQKIIKKKTHITKLVSGDFYPTQQPLFKVLRGQTFSKIIQRGQEPQFEIKTPLKEIFSNSYVSYIADDVVVKNFVDSDLPAECYEIKTYKQIKFTLKTAHDKFKLNISQTADALFFGRTNAVTAIFVMAKSKQFGTNLATKHNEFHANITICGKAKVFVVRGKTKSDVQKTIQQIRERRGELNYLIDENINSQLEHLLERMYFSRYITGEKLRRGFLDTQKLIPTLHLPTLVHVIESQDDLFGIIDSFDDYSALAEMGLQYNLVVMYSSQNAIVREMVEHFVSRPAVQDLVTQGVFMFWVDKMRAKQEAVYYLSKMNESGNLPSVGAIINRPSCTDSRIIISRVTHGNIQSIFLNNPINRSVACQVTVPLHIGRAVEHSLFVLPSVVTRTGQRLKITSQKTGHTQTLRVPTGARVYTVAGKPLDDGEHQTDTLLLVMEARIKCYGEKIFEIKKDLVKSDDSPSHKNFRSQSNEIAVV